MSTIEETALPEDEFEVLDDLLISVVRRIAVVEKLTVGGTELTLPESFVLRELRDNAEMSQQQLSDTLGIDKSRVSRVATALEKSGWVERHRDATNRRQYKVRLTKAGAKLAAKVTTTMRNHHAELFRSMSDRERSSLRRGLEALHRQFDHAWTAHHRH